MVKKMIMVLAGLALSFFAGCRTVKAPASFGETWMPDGHEKRVIDRESSAPAIERADFDGSKPLVIEAVVDIALRNSPGTREAWANARAAYTQVRQAGSLYYPQVQVSGDATRQRQSADDPVPVYDLLNYGPSAQVSWLLLDIGGRRAGVNEAVQNLLAKNFLFNDAIQDTMLEAQRSYYELHGAIAAEEAAHSDVEDAKMVYDAAHQKLAAGLAVKLDELQAQSGYESALYSLEEAKAQRKIAQGNLAKIMSFSADTAFSVAPLQDNSSQDLKEDDVSRLISEALGRRPDIAAMRSGVKALDHAVQKANSDLWPSISVQGSAGRAWSTSYDDGAAQPYDYQYSGSLGISWNIFDGFYNLNVKRSAAAMAESAREELRSAELTAASDVWTKYHSFVSSTQKLKFSKAYLKSAASSYELAQEGYKAGLKNILDFLHAQSELSSARSKLVQSQKDLHVAFAELAHATGSLVYTKDAPGVAEGINK